MKIKLGSSYGIVLKDINLKKKLISILFSKVNLSKYRFNMLNQLNKLKFLKMNEHYFSPNFRGVNYIMLFTKIDNKKYCVLIDKKQLSYHIQKINYYKLNIIKLKVFVDNYIFNNTVFDGKFIYSNKYSYFLIKDCYHINNNDITNMEMLKKLTYLDNIIKEKFNDNNTCENFIFKLNNLKTYDMLKDFLKNRFTHKIPIVGLEFYPKYSGIVMIYLDKEKKEISISNNEKNIESFSLDLITNLPKILMNQKYYYEEGEHTELYLKKTNIRDVYNVYNNVEDEKLSIAHIPNYKTSIYCYKNIPENEFVKFNCVYFNKFKKWIPISLA